jgi:hypothetical protein
MNHKARAFALVSAAIFVISAGASWAQSADAILAGIERLASQGSKADQELSETIAWQIEANPQGLADRILAKMKEPSATESQLATYAWALGWVKDTRATESLIALYRGSVSAWVKGNCARALSMIGGRAAGDFLLSTLDGRSDEDERYEVLDLLSEMQYEPALSRAGALLKLDFGEYYWKPVFIFGKMGDIAVPFLLSQIGSDDPNVRTHAIHLLGNWLGASEAAGPLRKRFWEEKDAKLQVMILGAIERTDPDLGSWKAFFEQVKQRSSNPAAVKFADETLASVEEITASVIEFKREEKGTRADFEREYAKILGSAGLEGDYDILRKASTLEDEARLKRLREHILTRNSDESFYDYEKVNHIIALHRLAARMKDKT